MKNKICFKCGITQPINDFYKAVRMRDGVIGKCKTCTKIDVAENRKKRSKYYKAFDKERQQTSGRRLAKSQYLKNSRAKFPKRSAVYQTVERAIRNGSLIRKPCEKCCALKSHAHHEDYNKPLDVVWLCALHHVQRHRELRGKI